MATILNEAQVVVAPETNRVRILEILTIGNNPQDQAEEHLRLFYQFKYNIVTGKIHYRKITEVKFKEVNDYEINTLLRDLKGNNISCSRSLLLVILLSDFTPKYDPFVEYLQSLPAWDGETDFIRQWADTITTTNQPFWRKCFAKWIVAAIGSLKDPATVNHTAPIFCGGQGIGKTRWIGRLVPKELNEYFFSGTINMSNKDSVTQLSECIFIDMDELENLGKTKIGDLKSLMTREKIRIRRPYGRMAENLPRRASFIGSINHKEFLKDETGSRRFLCFEVTEINHTHNLNVNNLYAQALALYNDGFQYYLDADEIAELQRNNEQFQKSFLEQELLFNHFEPATEQTATHFLPATMIAQVIRQREKMAVTHSSVQRIGKALAASKFLRVKRGGRYVWAVIDKRHAQSAALKNPQVNMSINGNEENLLG